MGANATNTDIRKKAIIKALENNLGIITKSCKEVGIARSTFYEWYKDDEEFRAKVDDMENITIDYAESKLHQLIKDENPTAIIFFLKTKGKKRGYVERQEIESVGETKIIFENVSKKYMEDA